MAYCPIDGKEMETVEEYPDTGTDVSFWLEECPKGHKFEVKSGFDEYGLEMHTTEAIEP